MNVLHSLRAIEIPVISEPLRRPIVSSRLLEKFSYIQFEDDYINNHQVHIDILVGLDLYWSLGSLSDAIEFDGLPALKFISGFVLFGAWHTTSTSMMSYTQFFCISKVSDFEVERFWDFGSIGISQRRRYL